MNHYEELGVSRSASLSDIRLAYKTLVRVLHPDQQQDENLRRMSELQLRRLNHILEVLTDPEQRRRYDFSLDRLLPAPGPPDPILTRKVSLSEIRSVRLRLHFDTGVFVWLLIGAIAVGSAVVWIRSPEPAARTARSVPEPGRPVPEEVKPATQVTASSQPSDPIAAVSRPPEHSISEASIPRSPSAVKPSPVGQRSGQKQPAPENLPAIRPDPPKKQIAGGPGSELASTPPVVVAEPPTAVEPPPLPAKAAAGSISGKWLYVPKPDDTKNSLYPAEYIELRISSRAGLLRGRYRGKYRVADRAISSEINFQFEGKQGESVSLLPWSSSNGSKGELRVKRLSDESIEVNWITTSFGTSNTLASGTAVLYRSDPP